MRRISLILSVFLLSFCSPPNLDFWSVYDPLPLEVVTLENDESRWIQAEFPLDDGSYVLSMLTDEAYYAQWCSGEDDRVLYTFPTTSFRLQGATLENDFLYLLFTDFATSPKLENPYWFVKFNAQTQEVEKETFFNIGSRYVLGLSLLCDATSLMIVCRGATHFMSAYNLDLEWISTDDFAFTEDDYVGGLKPLSKGPSSLLTDQGFYFVFEQSLFHKTGETVTQLPFYPVASLLAYENEELSLIYYDYQNVRGHAEHLYIDRITLNSDDQEMNRERLLSVESPYLEISYRENNTSFWSFVFFEGYFYVIGVRNESNRYGHDYGILRLDLDTLAVSTFLTKGERADTGSTSYSTHYRNGHYPYESSATSPSTIRQINFRVSST